MSNRGLSQSKNQHFSDLARSTSTTTLTKCPKSPSTIFPINMKQNVNPHSNINDNKNIQKLTFQTIKPNPELRGGGFLLVQIKSWNLLL